MGHNTARPHVGFRPKTVADAHWAGQPVVVWCIACGHNRSADAWHVFRERGNLIFGTIQRGFFCGKCVRSSIVVVLPVDAPTPWAWTRDRRAPSIGDDEKRKILLETEHLPWRIDAWSEDGVIEKLMARVRDDAMAFAVFDVARRHSNSAKRLTLRQGLVAYKSSDDPVA
jgi:hypothetical protein